MLLDAQEGLQLVRFLDGWDHDQVLQVGLQSLAPVIHCARRGASAAIRHRQQSSLLEVVEVLLTELVAALRKLDAGVLGDQGLMQLAEGSILLLDDPSLLTVEVDLDNVVRVVALVYRVNLDLGLFDVALQAQLEEMGSREVAHLLGAVLDVLHEDLGRVEGVTELALVREAVLVAFGEDLHLVQFGGHLMVLGLLPADGLAQHLVDV